MIARTQYLHHITRYRDTHDLVKVISGVRRSGKSLLMQQLHESLEHQGVSSSSIIHINFEDFTYRTVREAKDLYSHITSMLSKRGTTYILLDEIQMVKDWQEVVNSLRLTRRNDIYITGSNATLLSGTMATLLSGRYVEIRMLPLSFSEFVSFYGIDDIENGFNSYLRQGGLPGLVHLPQESDIIMEYLKGVVNTIVVKDISTHAQIRDIDILHKVIGFLASNIGQQVTATRVAHYLTSTGRKVSVETVDNYLRLLEEAFIFYRAKRF
ncbi:MAG: ATP-binding protein, partial [Sphaerochaetaceae bacterium]|nr:ATP-binding protein [Sphaerochaetaceae bacterium]